MPRICARQSFLLNREQPTYLDDLKADIEQDLNPEGLRRDIKEYVEITRSPPTLHEPAHFSPESVPFFPHLEAEDPRLYEYCRQLVELDRFLAESIGVAPGTLLPVWMLSAPKAKGQSPELHSLTISTGVVPALTAFMMQENGSDEFVSFAKRLKSFAREEIYKGSKNNPGLLDDALRWGREGIFTSIEVMESDDHAAAEFWDNPEFFSKSVLKIAKAKLEEMDYDSPFPSTFSGHIKRELERGEDVAEEYSRPFKKDVEKYQSIATSVELANKPSFRRKIERHIALGVRLMMGEYKLLW